MLRKKKKSSPATIAKYQKVADELVEAFATHSCVEFNLRDFCKNNNVNASLAAALINAGYLQKTDEKCTYNVLKAHPFLAMKNDPTILIDLLREYSKVKQFERSDKSNRPPVEIAKPDGSEEAMQMLSYEIARKADNLVHKKISAIRTAWKENLRNLPSGDSIQIEGTSSNIHTLFDSNGSPAYQVLYKKLYPSCLTEIKTKIFEIFKKGGLDDTD